MVMRVELRLADVNEYKICNIPGGSCQSALNQEHIMPNRHDHKVIICKFCSGRKVIFDGYIIIIFDLFPSYQRARCLRLFYYALGKLMGKK
jgi:hypothetical protein